MWQIGLCFPFVVVAIAGHAQSQTAQGGRMICNRDGSICAGAGVGKTVIEIPFYFQVRLRCPDPVVLSWELRDASGTLLDQDPDGSLGFLAGRGSGLERTIGVRDFALGPAKASRGELTLHATAVTKDRRSLPGLSIPVHLDTRTSLVAYAVPADTNFSKAVIDSLDSLPAQGQPIQAEVRWSAKTTLHVRPGMMGGAAAEAAARAYEGQSAWHVIDYRKSHQAAHLTVIGSGWAGVSYYLAGLEYLLKRTVQRQANVRGVVFDTRPDFAK